MSKTTKTPLVTDVPLVETTKAKTTKTTTKTSTKTTTKTTATSKQGRETTPIATARPNQRKLIRDTLYWQGIR